MQICALLSKSDTVNDKESQVAAEEKVEQVSELEGIWRGLEASDAGRVRSLAKSYAEMKAKYNLPTHLTDQEIYGGEVGGLFS